ncbi:hypothetical protein Ddc_16950 [Ditylenchus destructor]|nr:hypothetical protein Ddc_16950 [Ditylenchus destructor]
MIPSIYWKRSGHLLLYGMALRMACSLICAFGLTMKLSANWWKYAILYAAAFLYCGVKYYPNQSSAETVWYIRFIFWTIYIGWMLSKLHLFFDAHTGNSRHGISFGIFLLKLLSTWFIAEIGKNRMEISTLFLPGFLGLIDFCFDIISNNADEKTAKYIALLEKQNKFYVDREKKRIKRAGLRKKQRQRGYETPQIDYEPSESSFLTGHSPV